MKAMQGLHERIIQYGEDDRFNERPKHPAIVLKYELANGRTLSREYQLSNYDSYASYFKKIYESQEFKNNFYTLLKISPKDVYRVHITGNGNNSKSSSLEIQRKLTRRWKHYRLI